jgi:hypothetical protein
MTTNQAPDNSVRGTVIRLLRSGHTFPLADLCWHVGAPRAEVVAELNRLGTWVERTGAGVRWAAPTDKGGTNGQG